MDDAPHMASLPEDHTTASTTTTARSPRLHHHPTLPKRKSIARLSTTNIPTSDYSSASSSSTSPLARKKSYRDRMADLKEQMLRHAPPSRMRRSSVPHLTDAAVASTMTRFPTAFPSTSPSKRNAALPSHSPSKRNAARDVDRPAKHSRPLLGSFDKDRNDTPAPPPILPRPAPPSGPRSTLASVITGGDRARQAAAAAAHKMVSPCLDDSADDARDDLLARRARIGSMSSAADSGADLSTYAGSAGSVARRVDNDGDVDMLTDDPASPRPLDPLRSLPHELSLQIFEYLDAADLCRVERVSRAWRRMGSKTCVWRNAFLRQYQRRIYTNPAPIQVGGLGCGRPDQPDQPWKRMFKARRALDANWRKGAAGAGKAIYLAGHSDSVYCLQFDEEKIITGSRDRTIRVWDINTFTCRRVIGGPHVRPVPGPKVLRTVDYPDFHLATASVNGTAYGDAIYHVPSQWHDMSILCLQYDDEILVTGSSDNDLIVWDIRTYEPIRRLRRHTGGVLDVALDACHIVSCSKDSRIIVWDRQTLTVRGELTGHRGPVNAVQLRGRFLVSASGDGIARLWDLHHLRLVREFSAKERGLAAVEFSEDMRHVLAGGNDTITYKFETDTGHEVGRFAGHTQLVRSLWLDSHNSRVVSGSYDLDLRVYDFESGAEIWRAEEWTTSWMLSAKSDYRRIVATSQDGRILLVDFGIQKCVMPDDGQPLEDVDLLRGIETTTHINWRDPWASTAGASSSSSSSSSSTSSSTSSTVVAALAAAIPPRLRAVSPQSAP